MFSAASNEIRRCWPQNRLRDSLCFHFLLEQPRRFLFQTNIQGAVANQVAVPTRTTKRLKQNVLRSVGLRSLYLFPFALGPQASERIGRRLQFIASKVNRQKREHEVETVRIATKQNEIVIVSEGREPRFARVWQEPSPTKGVRQEGALLQMSCNNDVRLD